MECLIKVTEAQHEALKRHFAGSPREELAFLLCGSFEDREVLHLLTREVRLVGRNERRSGRRGLVLLDSARREVFRQAVVRDAALVEVHSHPGSTARVTFSDTDTAGELEIARYASAKLPGKPYGAMVWGDSGVDARVWYPASPVPLRVARVSVVGRGLRAIRPTSAPPSVSAEYDPSRYHRQILCFGAFAQRQFAELTVGVVGAGGIGSQVIQQLAYLGVGSLVIVDPDTVELANLNRLVGAGPQQLRQPKTAVGAGLVRTINPLANTRSYRARLTCRTPLRALRGVDVLIGCTDTDSSRLVMNEIAKAYLVPYIDCAVGINAADGLVTDIGGRVMVVTPDGPCLLCAKEIDRLAALEELEARSLRHVRRRLGYAGTALPQPSVVALDGVIASLAVNELIALVTGWREPVSYQTYYGDGRQLPCTTRVVAQRAGCTACVGSFGLGDATRIERYSWTGLPGDLPAAQAPSPQPGVGPG